MRSVVCLLIALAAAALGQDTFNGAPRVVAVGDVHGGYDEFTSVLKMAGLVHTLADVDYRTWPAAPEILRTMAAGGARALRWADRIGALEVGREADIALVDLDTLAFTPLNDLRRQLVYCENGSSVRTTIVAGQVVYENGRLTMVDEAALKREARALMTAYRQDMSGFDEAARKLEVHYREMYLRAHARDMGLRRRLDGP